MKCIKFTSIVYFQFDMNESTILTCQLISILHLTNLSNEKKNLISSNLLYMTEADIISHLSTDSLEKLQLLLRTKNMSEECVINEMRKRLQLKLDIFNFYKLNLINSEEAKQMYEICKCDNINIANKNLYILQKYAAIIACISLK